MIRLGFVGAVAFGVVLSAWAQEPSTSGVPVAQAALGQEAPPQGGAREIVLNRPFSRGEAYDLVFDLQGSGKGSFGIGEATSGSSHKVSFRLEGRAKVLSVSERGEPTLLLFQVGTARLVQEDKEKALDLDGAELGLSFPGGKPRFVRRDGKELPKEVLGLLPQVFPAPKEWDEDALLGPGRPVAPGESWSLSPESLGRMLFTQEQEEMARSARMEGTATFVGEETRDGLPGLLVRTKVKVTDLRIPKFVGTFAVEVTDDLWIAADRASHRSRRTTTTVTDLWGKILSGDGKSLDVKNKDTLTVQVEIR